MKLGLMASPIWEIIGFPVVSLLQTSTRLQFGYTRTGNRLHFGVTVTALQYIQLLHSTGNFIVQNHYTVNMAIGSNNLHPIVFRCQATNSATGEQKGITQTIYTDFEPPSRLPNSLMPSAKLRSENLPVFTSLVWRGRESNPGLPHPERTL